jgi:tetratricopeptide (TPR) repeat protein
VERVAVLRFENLSADVSVDWMGRALSEIVTTELTGAPGIFSLPAIRVHAVQNGLGARSATVPGISAERTAALAAGATKIAFGQYVVRGGTLEARMTVEDEITGKMTVLAPVTAPVGDIVTAGTDLARQISDRATPYGTKNPLVVQTHVRAFEHFNPELAEDLQKSIASDPDFGPAYRELAQLKIQQRDIAGAQEVLRRGMERNGIPAADRNLMRLEEATLRNDAKGRMEALTALSTAAPYDPQVWRDLAVTEASAHQYPKAVEAYRKATALEPDDPNIWNQLAYSAAYAGDHAAGTEAIERYRKLLPDSPNVADTLGDMHLIQGHLPQAEQTYLGNAKKHPDFFVGLDFLKAALAHLMTGDATGADGIAQQYFDARAEAKDPVLAIRKAQWAWISGRRKSAVQQMQQIVSAPDSPQNRQVAAHAGAELAMWTLMLGNREAASDMARKSADLAKPAPSAQATLARFFAQPPAPPTEWLARAKTLVPDPAQQSIGNVALAYALLFSKEFAEARPLLQSMYNSGNPSADEGLPVLLAWANVETGHIDEAATLLQTTPPLSDVGLTWSTPLYFPRIFYLRAVVAEKQGKADVARENWSIFHALSGPDPLMWGEEAKGK